MSGWWFGPQVGGNQVRATNASDDTHTNANTTSENNATTNNNHNINDRS